MKKNTVWYLARAADELLAHLAGVGEERLVALDAVRLLLLQDVLVPVQGLLTLGAVVAFAHRGSSRLLRSAGR